MSPQALMLAAALWAPAARRTRADCKPGWPAAPAGRAGWRLPGSAQDFQVNVGDRVFFETDQTSLNAQAMAVIDRQVQWLNQYPRYTFT
jgi:peptidoglycan-associated lipoprotein